MGPRVARAVRLIVTTGLLLVALPPAPAGATVLTITDYSDSESGPPPGSFRYLLQQAQVGDVIAFGEARNVTLVAPVDITVPGVTVQGPGGFAATANAPLVVHSDGASFVDLGFQGVRIDFDRGADNGVVVGSTFSAATSYISVFPNTSGTTIGSQAQPNVFNSNQETAVDLIGGTGTKVLYNQFSNAGKFGVFASGKDLAIRHNTFQGASIFGEVVSGEVTDNTVTTDQPLGIVMHSIARGVVRIADNTITQTGTASAIQAIGGAVAVVGNNVTLGPTGLGITTGCGGTLFPDTGTVAVRKNTVTGGLRGISYSCGSERHRDVDIAGNTISDAARTGIATTSRAAAEKIIIDDNDVTRAGAREAAIDLITEGSIVVRNDRVLDGGGIGIDATAKAGGTIRVAGGRVERAAKAGIVVRAGAGEVEIHDVAVADNGGSGVTFQSDAKGRVTAASIKRNKGAGVFVASDGRAAISKTEMGRNAKPGIDLAPAGVSANGEHKSANANLDFPSDLKFHKGSENLTGNTCSGCRVEVFAVEAEPRAGNPAHGEGTDFLGATTAAADGSFTLREVDCPDTKQLTTTTIRDGKQTSEFSLNVGCSAPRSSIIDPRTQPETSGPVFFDQRSCEFRRERSPSGEIGVVTDNCVYAYRFDPNWEGDGNYNYGVVFLQTTIEPKNNWCLKWVKASILNPDSNILQRVPSGRFAAEDPRRFTTKVVSDADGSALRESASVSRAWTLFPDGIRSRVSEDETLYNVIWEGATRRKIALVMGMEVRWDALNPVSLTTTGGLETRLERSC